MFQTKVVEKIKTHILCSVTFFFENRAIYEIIWKNIVDRGRPQMTVWRVLIAGWIPKATNTYTHLNCVLLIAFPLLKWLHERASMLRYMYIACLVYDQEGVCFLRSMNCVFNVTQINIGL
jgi:hypothetical protein